MGPKLKIYNTSHNNIRIKINFGRDGKSYSYRRGQKQFIRENTASDSDEYPFIIENYDILHDLLNLNGIDNESIEIDNDSIDYFYGYLDEYYGELNKEAVDNWWNHDLPDLLRYSVNKDRHSNGWGLNLICFYSVLVEANFMSYYLNDLTKEEINKLTDGYKHTGLYDEAMAYLEAKETDKLDEYDKEVTEYENKIQKIINEYKDEIINKFDGELYDVKDNGDISPYNTGLDLGFLNIYTANKDISKKKKVLYNANKHDFKWLSINLPYAPQSTTIKRKIFNEVKKVVEKELGETL